jgi:uncharacterized 2Fe-2S/4Fe-4S cluster protein (DUF4445 family)
MNEYQVTIMPENIKVNIEENTNLIVAAKKAGVSIESPCGGHGTCGKCAVKLISGEVDIGDNSHLPQNLKDSGYILACSAKVKSDIVIEVPHFSRLTAHKVVTGSKRTKFQKENDYFANKVMKPLSKKLFIKLDEPDVSDNINDFDRLRTALNKAFGLSNISISIEALRKLPFALRQGNWEVTITITSIKGVHEIIDVEHGKSSKPAYGIALDIGTTTVAASLLDLEKGKVIDREGTYNQQATYGSDVISRIIYTEENTNGSQILQKAVICSINDIIEAMLKRRSIKKDDVSVMVCAGNTVMSNLFMGVPTTYLRMEPYIPGATKLPVVKAKELGIKLNSGAAIVTVPSVASYVGGDITAGVLATMMTRSEELTLFIDVGTNGELVLGNSEWLVTCACSAGPAFEGSGISCGMRAMDGAIDRIEIDKDTLDVRCRTIGNTKALGICGSGLIYSLSEMMDAGIIDRAGNIRGAEASERIRQGNEGMEYVLVFADESGTEQDIVITEGDIKNLLRAKGAIFAGIRTMLQQVQLDISVIDRVYIAGGFGNYINITDAVNIGLLPDLPAEKYEYVGNSSLQGAMIVLLDQDAIEEAENLSDQMTYLELSIGNTFMDEFVSATFIPHTDMSLFPSVSKRLEQERVMA